MLLVHAMSGAFLCMPFLVSFLYVASWLRHVFHFNLHKFFSNFSSLNCGLFLVELRFAVVEITLGCSIELLRNANTVQGLPRARPIMNFDLSISWKRATQLRHPRMKGRSLGSHLMRNLNSMLAPSSRGYVCACVCVWASACMGHTFLGQVAIQKVNFSTILLECDKFLMHIL